MASVAASTATALTVVDPTSIPTRSCGVMASTLVARWRRAGGNVGGEREERPPAIHQIVDVQDEVRCGPGHALTMRHVVEGMPQLRTLGDERTELVETPASGIERLLELSLGFGLRF